MLHNFTYKLKVNLINKKKCLLRGNYSKSASEARQLSSDARRYLRHNIYISLSLSKNLKILKNMLVNLDNFIK